MANKKWELWRDRAIIAEKGVQNLRAMIVARDKTIATLTNKEKVLGSWHQHHIEEQKKVQVCITKLRKELAHVEAYTESVQLRHCTLLHEMVDDDPRKKIISDTKAPSLQAVAGVIRDKAHHILLFDHVKLGKFTIPVGKVEPGASPTDTLKKELYEELGIVVTEFEQLVVTTHGYKALDLKRLGIPLIGVPNDAMVNVESLVYNIVAYQGTISNKEPLKHKEIVWATGVDMERMVISDVTKDAIATMVPTFDIVDFG